MKRKRKIIIEILFIGILFWQFGFFNRFNYLTAKIDGWRDSARIVSTEPPLRACGVPCIGVREKFGFQEYYVGCVRTGPSIRGINAYNKEIEEYLNSRNGKDWRQKYQTEMDLLIENNRLE